MKKEMAIRSSILPGKFHGQRNLAGYRPRGHKESDTAERLGTHMHIKEAERRRIAVLELWLEKTLESPLDCKEIQPVHPKGDQSWVFFGRTDAEAEAPVLWPPHEKS